MAETPIYENPNGRRRRAARGENKLRQGLQNAKQFYIDNGAIDNGFRFNPVEHMFLRTGGPDPVKAPWSDGIKFSSSVGINRQPVIYDYDAKELESFIQETARIVKEDYGLDNVDVRTVYGTGKGDRSHVHGNFTWDLEDPNENHINIYLDEIWKDYGEIDGRHANDFIKGGGIESVKEKIKETIAHEMRHQWQFTTETGKVFTDATDVYESTKMNDYTNDFAKYYNKPIEKDARYHGEKFRRSYELKAKKYKERLNNPEISKKIEEINLRPKNRIIGHDFQKEPINISTYRKFDNVEPIDWDIDTGTSTATNKFDVSRNTRYRNAKLNRGQSSLRPRVTKQGNSMDFDSVHNYKAPHKTAKRQRRKPQSRSRTFRADDGSRVKQYLDKNGNVRAQVREWDDGRREVRRQHTARTIAKDPMAKNMSAASSMYDGETTEIHKRPNGDYFSTTKINHQTGEIETTYNKRSHKWGGSISEQQTVNSSIDEKRKAHDDYMKQRYGLEDAPEPPEPYTPKIGDNIVESETGERYVLSEIDKADPSLDIYNDTYYYNSPNGGRIVTQKPIDPNDPNGGYWLDDEYLTPNDVKRINNSFEDLRAQTDALEKAQDRLSSLKDDYANGNGDLNEIYEAEKAVRSLEEKVANTKHQINVDDRKFNDPNSPNHGYSINEKTQKNMDKAETLLNDYRNRTHQTIDDVFNESMPRQFVNTIEPGVDSAIEIINNTTVENNIKARTQTRGKKKNAQLTGRGGKKIIVEPSGRGGKKVTASTGRTGGRRSPKTTSTSTGRRKLKKAGAPGRGGKATKLRAVGKNGKVLSNIPRKIPLTKKDVIKTAANLVINEAATNTASTIIKNIDDINVPNVDNAPSPDSPNVPSPDNPVPDSDHSNMPEFEVPDGYGGPETWTDEDIADMADGDQDLYNELIKRRDEALNIDTPTPEPEQTGPQGKPLEPKPFSESFDPNDPDSWTKDDIKRMNDPSIWTNDDIKRLADGDMDYTKELLERRKAAHKGLDSGPKQGPTDFRFDTDDAPIPNFKTTDVPDTKMFDEDGLPQGLSKMDIAMTGLNILGAIGDYKDARRQGHGVVSSAVRAGVKFAVDEALGWWAPVIGIVKAAPGLAIKGADMLYKENRRMNSAANFQVFGDAQFMDTQQLATMRQSGMEMAKMAQYNLQQTLMGSEAKYLHR